MNCVYCLYNSNAIVHFGCNICVKDNDIYCKTNYYIVSAPWEHGTAAAPVWNQIKGYTLGYFHWILDSASNITANQDWGYFRCVFSNRTSLTAVPKKEVIFVWLCQYFFQQRTTVRMVWFPLSVVVQNGPPLPRLLGNTVL